VTGGDASRPDRMAEVSSEQSTHESGEGSNGVPLKRD
jgi:hypothetical protein